jgi:hypothetical protein
MQIVYIDSGSFIETSLKKISFHSFPFQLFLFDGGWNVEMKEDETESKRLVVVVERIEIENLVSMMMGIKKIGMMNLSQFPHFAFDHHHPYRFSTSRI